jgi:hypothetical protein
MNNIEEKIKATPIIQQHLIERYKKRLDWIRVTITILTPSLVLLIGLQEKPLPNEKLLNFLLLTSIALMTLSILTGLLVLLGESEAHGLAVAGIKEWVDSGKKIEDLPAAVNFPWHQKILTKFFPILVWLSILSLGSFGVLKYL